VLSHSVRGKLGAFCGTSLGKVTWEFEPGSLWASPHVSFLSADFALHPFTDINYDSVMSHGSPPGDALNCGWSWGPPTQGGTEFEAVMP
jgi:hypothetical protein